MAKAKAETSVGLSEIPVASAAPIPAAATPSVPLAGDSLAANRFVPNDGRDSFDDVMSRVTTMLETASQRCLRTHQIYESSRTRAVDTPLVLTTRLASATGNARVVGGDTPTGDAVGYPPGPEPAAYDDVATPAGVASKAALFLAETTAEPPPTARSNGAMSRSNGTTAEHAVAGALRRMGLGEAMVEAVSEGRRRGADLEALLLEAFSGGDPAPAVPCRVGSLLVVVGAGAPARRLGAALADEIGINPAEVPLASLDAGAYALATGTLLLRSAEDAAERAPGWRRSRAVVVVVDAAVAGGQRSWATHLIASLSPTAVWGVVDSTSKTEDVAAWAEALGGIDALALENTDATVSPAAALAAGIPVARINGQPATAARWVATIVDRMPSCR